MKWNNKFFTRRKLIDKKEDHVSFMQIIGFILIVIGVLYLLLKVMHPHYNGWFVKSDINGERISIIFFIVMLGVSLAFPSMLKNDKDDGLSTMRVVVFMMVNVICLLLLKIGWEQKSLTDIGLDSYWVGIIAFVFGGKATQSYFESKLAVPNEKNATVDSKASLQATKEIIGEAVKRKGEGWVNSFPNVIGVSARNKVIDGKDTGNCALIFKVTNKVSNLQYGSIPSTLDYLALNRKLYKIITDVVQEDMPKANLTILNQPPFQPGISVSRQYEMSTGTIGLLIKKNDESDLSYIVSCYHVFCIPELKNNNKTFSSASVDSKIRCASFEDNGSNIIGEVVVGKMDSENDFAIAKVDNAKNFLDSIYGLNISPKGFAFVFPEDEQKTVRMCGRTSGVKSGKIKSYMASQTVSYINNSLKQYYSGLIEIESISQDGDSGAAVINEENNVIGLLIAGNSQSSYVLPIKDFLLNNNFNI